MAAKGEALLLVGPARAGMIRIASCTLLLAFSWPRTSGDDPYLIDGVDTNRVLAPHERG